MEKKCIALRKLLEAVEKEILKKPNRKTLDRLSLLAGFQDWESFQEPYMATWEERRSMAVTKSRSNFRFSRKQDSGRKTTAIL